MSLEDDHDVRLALQTDFYGDILEGRECQDGQEDSEGGEDHHRAPPAVPPVRPSSIICRSSPTTLLVN